MAIQGQPRSYHKKFKFLVDIDGFLSAAFQKASELSVEAANVQYHEGGAVIPNKSPGRLTFSDVTLERGATSDLELYTWMKQVADAAAGAGQIDNKYKREVEIVQQDRDNSVLRRWVLSQAWPTKFVAGDWDNESDEVVINSVTLTYDFFDAV